VPRGLPPGPFGSCVTFTFPANSSALRIIAGWPQRLNLAAGPAGVCFTGRTGSVPPGRAVRAQHPAGGAIRYLLTALWLSWTV
jgi:hypothetical protein